MERGVFWAWFNMPTTKEAALKAIVGYDGVKQDGAVTQRCLNLLEKKFPGIKSEAYKEGVRILINRAFTNHPTRLQRLEKIFPGICDYAKKVRDFRNTDKGLDLRKRVAEQLDRFTALRMNDLQILSFEELYLWSKVLDSPGTLLAFLEDDPFSDIHWNIFFRKTLVPAVSSVLEESTLIKASGGQ